MATQISTYPSYLQKVKELVDQHLELEEEPLRLAIYYAPHRDEKDVFLFEVLDNFNGNSIEIDGDLLEVTYGSTRYFDFPDCESRLHIILTNPEELYKAVEDKTNRFQEVKQALAENHAQIIYSDPKGDHLQQVFQ